MLLYKSNIAHSPIVTQSYFEASQGCAEALARFYEESGYLKGF